MKPKTNFSHFLWRISTAWKILFFRKKRWILIQVNDEEFINHLKEEETDISFSYFRMQEYNMWAIIEQASNVHDDIDLSLMKAEFQAESELYSKIKEK